MLAWQATGAPVQICRIVNQWVTNNRSRIPKTLPGLLSLPPEYREQAVATLSPQEKSDVFRAYYRRILDDNPHLSSEQRTAVQEMISFLTPELYALKGRLSPEMRMHETELEGKLAEALPKDLRIPFLSAPATTDYSSKLSLEAHAALQIIYLEEALRSEFTAAAGSPQCDCYYNINCSSNYCKQGGCSGADTICGVTGNNSCTGVCQGL